jgi:hypothetical protein
VLYEVSRNRSAKKVFISNLIPDFDDPVSNVISRLETFFHLSDSIIPEVKRSDLVTNVFSELTVSELNIDLIESNFSGVIFQTDDWLIEDSKHLGPAIVRQLSKACDESFRFKPGLISVIILDFFSINFSECYSDLVRLLESNSHLDFEIIVIAKAINQQIQLNIKTLIESDVKFKNKIRFMESVHDAMLKSRGDIIAYISSAQLYHLSDLSLGIRLLIDNERCHFVLGSRNLRIFDLKKQIRNAYPTQPLRGFISYWGSLVISISLLLRFRRFITDPLSGVKIFYKIAMSEKDLMKISEDVDINLIKHFIKAEMPIQQFEVEFNSKQLNQSNRHSPKNGMKSLFNIWRV